MSWSLATWWWVGAGVLVAAELTTGSFHLLMVALGAVAGALAAHLGVGPVGQIAVAALVGGGATLAWHLRYVRRPRRPVSENRDVNLDVGETVFVSAWAPDGSARVAYRGSTWTARLAAGESPLPGPQRVRAVEGNWLVVAPEPSAASAAMPDPARTA